MLLTHDITNPAPHWCTAPSLLAPLPSGVIEVKRSSDHTQEHTLHSRYNFRKVARLSICLNLTDKPRSFVPLVHGELSNG
jgi:hypothetical protein